MVCLWVWCVGWGGCLTGLDESSKRASKSNGNTYVPSTVLHALTILVFVVFPLSFFAFLVHGFLAYAEQKAITPLLVFVCFSFPTLSQQSAFQPPPLLFPPRYAPTSLSFCCLLVCFSLLAHMLHTYSYFVCVCLILMIFHYYFLLLHRFLGSHAHLFFPLRGHTLTDMFYFLLFAL